MSLNGITGDIGETGPPKYNMKHLLPVFESGKRIVLYIFHEESFSRANGCYADIGNKDPELSCVVPLVDLPVIEINYPEIKKFPAALAYVKWRLENGI